MYFNYIHYAIPVFFIFIGIEVLISILRKNGHYDLHDSINNLSCGTVQQVIDVFVKAFMIAGYIFLYENYRVSSISITSVLAWVVCYLMVDLCYYCFHRASHRVNIIWTSHAAHHQSEEYNLTVALRQGIFERFYSWFFWLPLAIIGFPPLMYFACQQFDEIFQFFTHTKSIKKLGFLEYFLNTPSHHRVHHGKNPIYIDKNYAGTFIIWDKLFGTFQEEKEEVVYGTVEPLKSWNPLWANIKPINDIIKKSKEQKSLKNKIWVWFAPPGWKDDGTEFEVPRVESKTFEKYRTKINRVLTFYVLFQFIFILIASTAFLDNSVNMDLIQKILLGILLLLSYTSIAGILESKKWALYTEIIRLVMIFPVIFFQNSNLLITIALTAINIISLIAIIWFRSNLTEHAIAKNVEIYT